MAPEAPLRPPINAQDTLDRAPQLSANLSQDNHDNLQINAADPKARAGLTGRNERGTPPSSSSDEDIEDYDAQKPDRGAIVDTSRRGSWVMSTPTKDAQVDGQSRTTPPARSSSQKAIPIRLEKTDKRGRYMLHADDAEIRDILQSSLQARKDGSTVSAPPNRIAGFKDLIFTRQFTTFDRQNPSSAGSPFHGFFTLFWLAMAGLLLKVAAYNWKTYGSILGSNELLQMMFSHDVMVLGATDGVMCASTAFGLGLQKLVAKRYISWARTGYVLEHLWQAGYLVAVVGWTFYREWPWTHTIFIVLHCLVFLMKQHSYSFYNGYCKFVMFKCLLDVVNIVLKIDADFLIRTVSQVYRRKQLLERKLEQLQTMTPSSPTAERSPSSHSTPSLSRQVSPTYDPSTKSTSPTAHSSSTPNANTSLLRHRRKSSHNQKGSDLTSDRDEITSILTALSDSTQLTPSQLRTFNDILTSEIDALDLELRGKCATSANHYPDNLTLRNFADWTCLPTLVYELEYPRSSVINWWYVAEKTIATFGVIGVMMVISQAYIYPPVTQTVRMKEMGLSVAERWVEFPWIVSDMLFPLLLEQLLSWYVIWECVLNVLAEVTQFADRGFYGDWWNSVSWDQYARDWNRPVHNFLLRHVYHSSISAFQLSKTTATFVTFLLSACVHELMMYCLFHKVRGYLFAMQLLQMPLVMLSRTKMFKGRELLGNVVFWIGLFVGPSFLTSLYLVV